MPHRTATAVAAGLMLLATYCLMTATTAPYARYAVGCGGDPALAPLRFDFALDVAPGHAAVPSLEVDGHEVRRHRHRDRVAKSFALSEVLPAALVYTARAMALLTLASLVASFFNSRIVSTVFVVTAALLTVGVAGFTAHVALQSNPAAVAAMPLPEPLPEAAAAHAALTKEILRAHEHPPSVAGDETAKKKLEGLEELLRAARRRPAEPPVTPLTIGAACAHAAYETSFGPAAWRIILSAFLSLLSVVSMLFHQVRGEASTEERRPILKSDDAATYGTA